LYPEILRWGPIHVRSYGLMMAVAFLFGTWLALREARRRGLDEDRLVSVILVALVGGVLGARLLYVIEHIEEFRRQWGSALAIWEGGLTLYGGVVAGTLAGLVTARRLGLPMWIVADALTPSVAIGTAFGRIGCFLNGCCYGRPTTLPWGVRFPDELFAGLEFGNAKLHPSQLYFVFSGLFLFSLTSSLRSKLRVPGHLFWLFILLFALIRIPLDLTRAYEASAAIARLGPVTITESQFTSLAMAMFAALMMVRLSREHPSATPAPAGPRGAVPNA
jgi:phosphatidylglycerol:prolipoprotein diacylglycerol transferase